MQETPKNYLNRGPVATIALIALLVAVSFIPPQSIGGTKFRRANILADLVTFDDAEEEAEVQPELFDEQEFLVDLDEVASRIEADTLPDSVPDTFEWNLRPDSARFAPRCPDSVRLVEEEIVPIEDFDTTRTGIRAFCDTLLHARRPVRIAVLGDSFIEGDILTADLREKMQLAYGGGGAGFAPAASPLTGFRRTIRTEAKGWTSYNIMQRKKTPEPVRNRFFVSGWVSLPAAGAATRWSNGESHERLDSCTAARFFFRSPENSRIEVTLNDTLKRTFEIPGGEALRQIVVRAPHVRSMACRIPVPGRNFIGYGAVFEGDGVVVDNYSVRSNNGQAMFWTDPSVNARADLLVAGYDLVILQYGLNIMQAGVRDYSGYSRQIEKMVAFVRRCFPKAAVLILGVSDRSVKNASGDFEPMDAIPYMTESQRQAARNTGAAFWPTCEAMRRQGGMARFVQSGWAGKDYTHINHAGGRRVAWALVDAINALTAEVAAEKGAAVEAEGAAGEAFRNRAAGAEPILSRQQRDDFDRLMRRSGPILKNH